MQSIEAFCQHFIKSQQCRGVIPLQECIHQRKAIFIVQHIQIAQDVLIFHICAAERNSLVEDRKRITHCTVSLMCYHMQGLIVDCNVLADCHHPKVLHNILDCDPVEIIGLATRKNCRKDLVFLSGRKNEYSMRRRFLQSLEKGIESRLRKHMHLVDDIYAIAAYLRRYAHLLHQCLDVLYTVIRRSIKLVDAVRPPFRKRKTRLTLSTWLHICRRVGAVDHLCKDSGSGCLAHSARSAKEICVRELATKNRVLQRLRDIILTDKCSEGIRSVLSC